MSTLSTLSTVNTWASEQIDFAAAFHRVGALDKAEALYRAVLNEEPDHLNALQLLGLLFHQRGRAAEAVALLQSAIAVLERRGEPASRHAVLFNNFGNALRAAGRNADAIASYRRGLALDPTVGEIHANLGNALLAGGDVAGAIACYDEARQRGHFAAESAHTLADALIRMGAATEAITVCGWLIEAAPGDADAHELLGRARGDSGDNGGAINAFRRCLELNPHHAAALFHLGATLAKVGLGNLAIPVLEMAVEVDPDDARLHAALGNVQQALGQTEQAFASFHRACALQPIITWAATTPARFSALLITSPGIANTPPDFLLRTGAYDRHFFALLPDATPDLAVLRRHGDIVVNLISDVDQGRDMLVMAAGLIDRLGKHPINHPGRILDTGRDNIAALLGAIPRCRVPRTIRANRQDLTGAGAVAGLTGRGFWFPLLLRVAGTHGGEAFEKIENVDGMAAFLATHPADQFYVTAFVDYRSHDGRFRKYRFAFAGDAILPYHLAIGTDWKVHHYSTDMDQHVWMQQEEAAFLDHPGQVFSPAQFAALSAIRDAVGLDFFGIDCSLDRGGNVVVFEVNASMLIHDDNADFPYKTPHCLRIKDAFEAMLTRAALSQRAAGTTPADPVRATDGATSWSA